MRWLWREWARFARGVRRGVLCWAGVSLAEQAARQEAREIDDTARIERARRAEALMADPLLNEAFDAVEGIYTEAWKRTASDQARERERLWDAIAALRAVKTHIAALANEGALLEREVHTLQRAKQRI